MAGETHTEKINKLERFASALDERVDNLKRDLARIEADGKESARAIHDATQRLAVLTRDVEHLGKRVDDLLSRRWELWKLVLAAFLGGLVTLGAGFVSKWLERFIAR